MKYLASSVIAGSLDGTQLSPLELAFLEEFQPAGLTVFGRNIDQNDHQALARLARSIQSNSSLTRLIMIDQEGGRVARLKGDFPNLGTALSIEHGNDTDEALAKIQAYGRLVGKELIKLGVNVNFAPVVDVLTEPTNTAIGERVWGVEPKSAKRRAEAWLTGLQDTGVLGCLKHFPGQGDAKIDTHIGEAVIDLPKEILENRELVPFKALLDQAPMVMISHCIYPAWDSKPASLSRVIMEDLLRTELGFKGVVVSDDMTMGAIPSDEKTWGEAVVSAIASGADLVLVCHKLELWKYAINMVSEEAKRSSAFLSRLTEASERVNKMRQRLVC